MRAIRVKAGLLAGKIERWAVANLACSAIGGALMTVSQPVAAHPLVFGGGLPTGNLNNAAAANLSNLVLARR